MTTNQTFEGWARDRLEFLETQRQLDKERICALEMKYHAAQKGNIEEYRFVEHIGTVSGAASCQDSKEIRPCEGPQSGRSNCLGGEAKEPTKKEIITEGNVPKPISNRLDSWKYEAKQHPGFGLAPIKREGSVEILSDPGRDLVYYISGPMTGIEDHNRPLFIEVARTMRESGYRVINPTDISDVIGPGRVIEHYMRADIKALMDCTAIMMLHDWESSHGAFLEFTIARQLHLPIYYWKHYAPYSY